MGNIIRRGDLETFLIFLFSPLVSLPFIFLQLKNKRNSVSLFLLSVFFGFLSFLYVPDITNDKTRYIERYVVFKNYNFDQLLYYFQASPDYIFDTLLFIFAKVGISYNVLFLFLTTFTVYSIFIFVKKIISKSEVQGNNYNILFIVVTIFSFSMPGLFSGIRFGLAGSIFVWVVYYIFFNKKLKKAVLLFALTIFIHFSYFLFIPAILLILYKPNWLNVRVLLTASLFFIFLPKIIIFNLVPVNLPEAYAIKADAYLNWDREVNNKTLILGFIKKSWLYFSFIFLILLDKNKNLILFSLISIFISVINVTYSVPIIFNRYIEFIGILMVAYIVFLRSINRIKPIYFNVFFMLICARFFVDVFVLKANFGESYKIFDMLTIVDILNHNVEAKEIISY
jgi:hypothetical protein